MTYTAKIETFGGLVEYTVTDEQIDALPGDSAARIYRDDYRAGVDIAPSEVAGHAYRESVA